MLSPCCVMAQIQLFSFFIVFSYWEALNSEQVWRAAGWWQ